MDRVWFPEIYLESLFYNFISNGIKYRHPDRSPVIQVISKQAQGMVSLEFSDNGLGMDLEKDGSRLFGLHQRLHLDRYQSGEAPEGSGLGLFMCKNQVETLGGRIEVESQVDQGTTFRLFLIDK